MKIFNDRYRYFPSGYRYLVRCRRWTTACSVTKALSAGWGDRRNWLWYHDALIVRDRLIANGNPTSLAFVLKGSGIVVADIDADVDGKLSDLQLAFVNYHKKNQRTLIIRSSGGVGYHLYFSDPELTVQAVSRQSAISELLPCEVLVNSVIVAGAIVQPHWISYPSIEFQQVIDRHRAGQQIPDADSVVDSLAVSCPLLDQSIEVSDFTLYRIRRELSYFSTAGRSLIDSPNGEADFRYLMKCLKGLINEDEFVNFCRTQPFTLNSLNGETVEQYFANVRAQFRNWRSPYPLERRPNVFFGMTKKRREIYD